MVKYSQRKFIASTIKVNYVEGPDNGPPVLLIHGIGGFWENWSSVIDELASNWHVYAIDLRGHGDSGRTPGEYRFIDYPIEIIEFLKKIVTKPAFLIGHSLGAVAAAGVCAVTPNLVIAGVLEDPPLYVEQTDKFKSLLELRKQNLSVEKNIIELRKIYETASNKIIERRAIAIYKVDPEVWIPTLEGGIAELWDPDAVLSEITTPTLLLQANPDKGSVLSDSQTDQAINLLGNGRLVKWEDVGHGMHDAQPDRFIQLVNAYCNQILKKQAKN